jgi:hypothetical protein
MTNATGHRRVLESSFTVAMRSLICDLKEDERPRGGFDCCRHRLRRGGQSG